MSYRYVEKSFLYLLLVSLALHLGVLALLVYLPAREPVPPKEAVFLDLQQMPELKPTPAPLPQKPRPSDRRMRVQREVAPRSFDVRDSRPLPPPPVRRPPAPADQRQQPSPGVPREPAMPGKTTPLPPVQQRENQVSPGSSVSSLLKPRQQQKAPQLFPAAAKMARLEENYRRKFENEIAEGETRFLNTEDIQFGSFLRRFENSVYGVWRYPQEAAKNGVEGITPVKITFNRRGEVTQVDLLETSGSRVLDDEVLRTLRAIGPVGNFPRGYEKDEFHLIAFFHYGLSRKSLR